MGNESHLSFNRAITNDKFTEMLTSVVKENYDEFYDVEVSPNVGDPDGPCWTVRLRPGFLTVDQGWSADKLDEARWHYSLYIWRATDYKKSPSGGNGPRIKHKGKFSHGHMSASQWGYWFMEQLHGHFCVKYGARTSDDGNGVVYKADPTKYPTFAEHVAGYYPKSLQNPKGYEWMLLEVPEGLKKLRD